MPPRQARARSDRFWLQAFFRALSQHLSPAPNLSAKASCSVRSRVRPLTMADAQVFEETFTITSVNNEKHELFPVEVGQTISLVLATTLALDGSAKGDNDSMWRSVGKQGVTTLADMYDYVCYGKNYRMEGGDGDVM